MLNSTTHWSEAANDLQGCGEAYVLITLLESAGSTPRIAGSKMVVTTDRQFDTIGGGHLEYAVIEHARELLKKNQSQPYIKHFPLGATLGQCCGGSVSVLFEVIQPVRLFLDIYGAGHIAHHLVTLLSALPIKIRWIDNREGFLPETTEHQCIFTDYPVGEVRAAHKDSAFLILTHNHQLDFDLARAVLTHHPENFLGVIGSDTKAKRFANKLSMMGFDEDALKSLHCPVGVPNIQGKLPMEVALSIAGQLVGLYQGQTESKDKPLRWGVPRATLKPLSQHEKSVQSQTIQKTSMQLKEAPVETSH